MVKTVKLSAIQNYIPKYILEEMGVNNVMALAYDYYTSLSIRQKMVKHCKIVPISNHTIRLDRDEYKNVISVYYLKEYDDTCTEPLSVSHYNDCITCKEQSLFEQELNDIYNTQNSFEIVRKHYSIGCTISYQLFEESQLKKDYSVKMKNKGLRGEGFGNDYCKDCDDYTYSIDSSGTLRSDVCDGWAIVHYESYPLCDGEVSIIDDNDLFEYIRIAIQLYYMDTMLNQKTNMSLYNMLLRRRDVMRTKVQGNYTSRNININEIKKTHLDARRILLANPMYFNHHLRTDINAR